jgi:hypothetical protein
MLEGKGSPEAGWGEKEEGKEGSCGQCGWGLEGLTSAQPQSPQRVPAYSTSEVEVKVTGHSSPQFWGRRGRSCQARHMQAARSQRGAGQWAWPGRVGLVVRGAWLGRGGVRSHGGVAREGRGVVSCEAGAEPGRSAIESRGGVAKGVAWA